MTNQVQQGYVKTETHNAVTTIEFFHPQSNSLPKKLLDELVHAIHGAGNEQETRVIILRSAGEKAFVRGLLLMNCRPSAQKKKDCNSSVGLRM
jgi:methylglutaconyl-CoA hydratase